MRQLMDWTDLTLCHDCMVASIYGVERVTNNPAYDREWLTRFVAKGYLNGYDIFLLTSDSRTTCEWCGSTEQGERYDTRILGLKTGGN